MAKESSVGHGRISGYTAEAIGASVVWAAILGAAAVLAALLSVGMLLSSFGSEEALALKIASGVTASLTLLVSLRLAYAMFVLWKTASAVQEEGSVTAVQTAVNFAAMAAILQSAAAYALIFALRNIAYKVVTTL